MGQTSRDPQSHPGQITQLLGDLRKGSPDAQTKLIDLVYAELRRLAAIYMRRESPGHTLQPTALVHEAYLRMMGQSGNGWEDRAHFFAAAAQQMRRILVDHARAHRSVKRGGSRTRIQVESAIVFSSDKSKDLIALDDALTRLSTIGPRQAQVVELRFFGGLTEEEIGKVLGIAHRTVKRDWSFAKTWLFAEMNK